MIGKAQYQLTSCFPALPRTNRGMPVVVGVTPDRCAILYTNGHSVYTRNVQDLSKVDIYTEHPANVTVAKVSPSGFYCASGDIKGNLRVWDTVQVTHHLKLALQVFSGPVLDIAWSFDSQRIAVVGAGCERFARVILFNTGTSNGDLTGMARAGNSIDFKPKLPLRLISGSDDFRVYMFAGPPFKFTTSFQAHTGPVYVTRYNPSGTMFATGGADGKVYLRNGTDGSLIGELVDTDCEDRAHTGSVFSLCWSLDGLRVVTASGDCTIKIWDPVSMSFLGCVKMGDVVNKQQLSVTWTSAGILSVSTSGHIRIVNPNELNNVKIVGGHNKSITTMAVTVDKRKVVTGDCEGNINIWDVSTGMCTPMLPKPHTGTRIVAIVASSDSIISVAWDDRIVFNDFPSADDQDFVPRQIIDLPSQPVGLTVSESGSEIVIVACHEHICVLKAAMMISSVQLGYIVNCVSFNKERSIIAVGGMDKYVHLYRFDEELHEMCSLPRLSMVTAVAFSPDGRYLAATDGERRVIPYEVDNEFKTASNMDWCFHTAKVTCVSWSPDSRRLCTGGIDASLFVWDLVRSSEHPIHIRGAHAASVSSVGWLDDKTIVSSGLDCNVKMWTVPFPPN